MRLLNVFNLYKQAQKDFLPLDWEEHLIKFLIRIHETKMPEEIRFEILELVGEVYDEIKFYTPIES